MKNKYEVIGKDVVIRLNRRLYDTTYTTISKRDFKKVDAFPGTWFVITNGPLKMEYVAMKVGKKTRLLHRVIMNEPEGMQVDHKDSDTLNNRRKNLQAVSAQRNAEKQRLKDKPQKDNTSGVKNVQKRLLVDGTPRWLVWVAGEYIGTYKTRDEAGKVAQAKRDELNYVRWKRFQQAA